MVTVPRPTTRVRKGACVAPDSADSTPQDQMRVPPDLGGHMKPWPRQAGIPTPGRGFRQAKSGGWRGRRHSCCKGAVLLIDLRFPYAWPDALPTLRQGEGRL